MNLLREVMVYVNYILCPMPPLCETNRYSFHSFHDDVSAYQNVCPYVSKPVYAEQPLIFPLLWLFAVLKLMIEYPLPRLTTSYLAFDYRINR